MVWIDAGGLVYTWRRTSKGWQGLQAAGRKMSSLNQEGLSYLTYNPCPRRRLKGSPLFRPEGRDGP